MIRSLIAGVKLFAFMILIVLLTLTQPLVLLFTKGPASYIIPQYWHRAICWVFGIKTVSNGQPHGGAQVIFMSNHLSYMDIPMLGSLIRASFVAKQEVASWPLFGFISRFQQTAFIERKRTAIATAKNALQAMVGDGKNLIIFPEGTSTDGRTVYDFKSSLFSLALGTGHDGLVIQPVTVQAFQADGSPVTTQAQRDHYSWHVEMDTELLPHLWAFAKSHGAILQVTFHPALLAAEYSDRKILSKTCHEAVSSGLKAQLVA